MTYSSAICPLVDSKKRYAVSLHEAEYVQLSIKVKVIILLTFL